MNVEIEQIKKIISETYGFEVREKWMDNLARTLRRRSSVNGFEETHYLKWIIADQSTPTEWQELMDDLVINETYFFRNPLQFQYLEKVIIPELMKSRLAWRWEGSDLQPPKMRMLSAGCATGEEPYSIAMSLIEEIKYARGWDLQIDAFDLSTAALEVAKEGRYRLTDRMKSSLDQMNGDYLTKYFSFEDGQCKVADEVRERVRFLQGNLKSMFSAAPMFASKYDVIFCRNVMIYFGAEDQQKLVRFLENSLEAGGYLMMGDAETLHLFEHRLELVQASSGLIYQKASEKRN